MGDKGHFWISMGKSAIRIIGCVIAALFGSVIILAVCFGMAEILGVAEEFADKRGTKSDDESSTEDTEKTIGNVIDGDVRINGELVVSKGIYSLGE